MFFSVLFCTVRLSIFERFVFASFEPLRFCKKVRFVFPDLYSCGNIRGVARLKFECKGEKRVSQTNFIKERAVSNSVWSNDTALPF